MPKLDPPHPAPLRILGVYAHPDDETFCIGGTLAKYTAAGAQAMVVSFTQGEAGQIREASAATRRTLGEVRANELHQACRQLGVQQIVCLDYGDGKLEGTPQVELVAHIVQIIREFKPDIVFTFDDTGAYGHPDHIAISLATTEACWQSGITTAFAEQIEKGLLPHAPTRLYHSLFPQSDRLLLQLIVEWLQSLDDLYRGSDDFMHGLMLFADESSMLGYASDHIQVEWYPTGFYIIEQGEPSISLYLILSGQVDVLREDEDGKLVRLASLGAGVFIGETGIAYGQPRNAHVVAVKNTTCLVLSPGEPTNFAGRGEEARFGMDESAAIQLGKADITTCIDVSDFIEQKIKALSQHRSQYPISLDMFPLAMWREMLGQEFFKQIDPPRQIETDLLTPND